MKYLRYNKKDHYVIERNPKEIVSITHIKTENKGWVNLKMNHSMTLSYHPIMNIYRLWVFGYNRQPTYTELTPSEFKRVINYSILICGKRAQKQGEKQWSHRGQKV